MGLSFSGFVKKGEYTQETDGTFTCKLNYLDDPSKPTVVSTKSIKCIGVLNVNNIKSPNHPDQMMILSDDNKYIFIPIDANTNTIRATDYCLIYYILFAILNYGIAIPNCFYYVYFVMSAKDFIAPTNDSTYNSLPEGNRKANYKYYLMSQNPSPVLLRINSDRKVWTEIGYIFKVIHDLNIPDSTANYVPPSYCIKVDSPTIISYVSQYDCRSNATASPVITKSLSSLFSIDSIDSNSYGVIAIGVGVVCCLMCMSGCALMAMMSNKSRKSKK